MYGKALNVKDAKKILKNNGYEFVRQTGSHLIFQNADGREITITCRKLSQKTWKRECKKHNIVGGI